MKKRDTTIIMQRLEWQENQLTEERDFLIAVANDKNPIVQDWIKNRTERLAVVHREIAALKDEIEQENRIDRPDTKSRESAGNNANRAKSADTTGIVHRTATSKASRKVKP